MNQVLALAVLGYAAGLSTALALLAMDWIVSRRRRREPSPPRRVVTVLRHPGSTVAARIYPRRSGIR